MTIHGLVPLSKLFRRLIFSFALSIIGCWGLIIPRLNVFHALALTSDPNVWLYLDVGSLAVAILGVFLILWYRHLILPRLARLEKLGESSW
jgi:hypothetical protein